eukprot:4195738-Prymnesium_polylepis.1
MQDPARWRGTVSHSSGNPSTTPGAAAATDSGGAAAGSAATSSSSVTVGAPASSSGADPLAPHAHLRLGRRAAQLAAEARQLAAIGRARRAHGDGVEGAAASLRRHACGRGRAAAGRPGRPWGPGRPWLGGALASPAARG